MSEAKLARAPIESRKEAQLRAWFDELRERESEVVETLRHEGVHTETAFIQSFGGTTYLYVYMEAENLRVADEAGDEEKYQVDEEHHDVLRDVRAGDWEELETLGHFVNPSLR